MSRRRALVAGLAAALLLGGALAAFLVYRAARGSDVTGSSTEEFVTTEAPRPKRLAPKPKPKPRPKPGPAPRTRRAAPPPPPVYWPTYGFDERRQRWAGTSLRPPFRRAWTFRARSLVEFPPVIGYGRIYFASNHGVLFAVNAKTGRRAWSYRSGRCVAASPAIAYGTVYASFLNEPPCNAKRKRLDGEVIAFAPGFGAIRWRRTIGPTESSPLVAGRLVVVGDWNGVVWALDALTGKTVWRFRTGGKIKGAAALADGRVVIGSYDHNVYALAATTGKLLWKAAAQERIGFKTGTFYATPALAFGRAYVGATDGWVYSFGARTGELRWRHGMGGYVYASAALWKRLVLVGAYNGRFSALDAATGEERWRFEANGPISGSATVLGDVVYFATLAGRTYALDAATGRQLWSYGDGKYTPVVADPDRLYLVGYTRVYGMEPR